MKKLAVCTAEEHAQPTRVAPGVQSRPLPLGSVFVLQLHLSCSMRFNYMIGIAHRSAPSFESDFFERASSH